jgi:hypothetical protein
LLCLGHWSLLELIKSEDVESVSKLPDIQEEEELEEGWDALDIRNEDSSSE